MNWNEWKKGKYNINWILIKKMEINIEESGCCRCCYSIWNCIMISIKCSASVRMMAETPKTKQKTNKKQNATNSSVCVSYAYIRHTWNDTRGITVDSIEPRLQAKLFLINIWHLNNVCDYNKKRSEKSHWKNSSQREILHVFTLF